MTFSGSSTQSYLMEIQRQLASIKLTLDSLKNLKNGISAHFSSNDLKWYRGAMFVPGSSFRKTGYTNNNFVNNEFLPIDGYGIFNGATIANDNATGVTLKIPLTGQWLYRQFWVRVGEFDGDLKLNVNGRDITTLGDFNNFNSENSLFYTEHLIDSREAEELQILWVGTATSMPALNALQLFPLS